MERAFHMSASSLPSLSHVLFAYLSLELLFFLAVLTIHRTKMTPLSPAPPYCSSSNRAITSLAYIKKILARIEALNPSDAGSALRSFLSGWCLNAPFDTLKRDNIGDFLAWAMFNRHLRDCGSKEIEQIDFFFEHLRKKHGVVLPPGHNSQVKSVQLSLGTRPMTPNRALTYNAYRQRSLTRFALAEPV